MKMKQKHFNHIKSLMQPIIDANPEAYNNYKSIGLTDERYRWDIFHAAGGTTYSCDVLYKYLNDNHIDTALRRITNTTY